MSLATVPGSITIIRNGLIVTAPSREEAEAELRRRKAKEREPLPRSADVPWKAMGMR